MVKAVLDKVSSPSRSDMKKQRKKEAKVKLELEQARKDVHKAEQKVAKAQMQLEARNTHLRVLEEKLNKKHYTNQEQGTSVTGAQTQQEEVNPTKNISDPVAEVPQEEADPTKDTTDEGKKEKELEEIARETHVPTPPQSVTPWPPLEIREEIAESAEKEVQGASSTAQQESPPLPAEDRADVPLHEESSESAPQTE